MAHRGSEPAVAGRRRLIAGVVTVGAAAAIAFVLTSGNAPARQLVTGAKPSTTTTPTTTPPQPYSNPSVDLSDLTYTASLGSTTISGSFVIHNVSGHLPTDVVVTQQRITVEYKTSAGGKYTLMAAPTCTFTPTAPYTILFQQQQSVSFTCTLASAFPSNAKFVRVTAIVTLQGRAKDFRLAEERAL